MRRVAAKRERPGAIASRRALRRGLFAGLFLLPLAAAGPARAQDPAPAPATAEPETATPRLAEIQKEIEQLRSRTEEWAQRSAEYETARTEAPARLEAIEREIEELEKRDAIAIPERAGLAELEAAVLGAEQDLVLSRQEALELNEEAARRSERRKKIPELLAAAKERLRALEQPAAPPVGASPELLAALAELQQLRREAIEKEILGYQNELSSYEARGQLLAKRRDRATLRIAYYEAQVAKLRDAVKLRQQLDAERAAREAEESLAEVAMLPLAVQDLVRELAEQNAQLAQLRTGEEGLVEKIDEVSGKLARAEARVAVVEADLASLAERIEAAGLTDSVGLLLRKQRYDAPDVGKYRRFIRMRRDLISAVQLQQIELREQRRGLADIDRLVERAMEGVAAPVDPADREGIRRVLERLFRTRRETMDAIIEDYEDYFQKLVDFDAKQQELIDRTERLLEFIDERILWIPSGTSVAPQLLYPAADAIGWLATPRYWGQLSRALRDVARSQVLLNLVVVLLLALSVPIVRRARPRIRELGEEARSPACSSYAPTWESLGLTLLLVPWAPGLLAYLGWRLSISPEATQFTRSVAHGMLAASVVWFNLRLLRQILRPRGLAEDHFGWPSGAVNALGRHLRWLAAVVVPAVLIIYLFEMRGEEPWKESVGRLAFVVAMTAAAVFAYLVLRERGGALAEIARTPGSAWSRPWVWRATRVVAIATPLGLSVAALRGYYWTSLQLASRVHVTLVFLFVLAVGVLLAARWSLIMARRVALEQARQRRETRLEQLRQEQGQAPVGAEAPAAPEEEALDLGAVKAQTGRLTSSTALFVAIVGLWVIWADVLPAVGILREVELWTSMQTVSVEVTDAAGAVRLATEEQLVPVTLADLFFATLIGLVALALVRNLPGILDVTVLRRLGAGERYAYSSLVKYAVVIGGIALAFDALGIGWSNIQWLIAAVGLGLGFGLQEIFANFVSGLIILFERPIRVGDTVTVGDVSGTVSRIRIRATWITGFDRKELVVPNKEFVTSRLVNWSLSDPVLRVDIPVGIAYGSDTERAIEVLRRVAAENEHVLREPPPQVLFLGFGDSSLSFELRAFSPDTAHLIPIRHQLHMAIDRAFREAGIEIAFPQRDVHLRSVPPAPTPRTR